MDHRQMGLCLVGIAGQNQGIIAIPQLWQFIVTGPTIGSDFGAFRHIFQNEEQKAFGIAAFNQTQAEPPGVNQLFERDTILVMLALLDGPDDRYLVMHATALAFGAAANEALIHFHNMLAADTIPIWPDHSRSELVENLESSLVARKSELPLKLKGGLARGLGGHEICAPKPDRERSVG